MPGSAGDDAAMPRPEEDPSNAEREAEIERMFAGGDRGDHRHPRRYYAATRSGGVARMLLNYNAEEEDDDDEEEEEEEEEDEDIDDASTAAGTTATLVRPSPERLRMDTAVRAELPPDDAGGGDLLLGGGSSVDDGATTAAPSSQAALMIPAVPNLKRLSEHPSLREIGMEDIISLQLSSAKPGNGVEQLQDPNLETYWQSDGISQPHWIQVQMPRRLPITHVALYLDYQLDESYTPRMVRIDTGLTVVVQDLPSFYDGNSHMVMEVNEPVGWCIFPIYLPPPLEDATTSPPDVNYIPEPHRMVPRAHWVRISILSMHQNGRDTHVRRMALFGQRTAPMNVLPRGPIMQTTAALMKREMTKPTPTAAEEEEAMMDHEEILLYAQTRRRPTTSLQHRPEGAASSSREENTFTSHRSASSLGMSLFSTIR